MRLIQLLKRGLLYLFHYIFYNYNYLGSLVVFEPTAYVLNSRGIKIGSKTYVGSFVKVLNQVKSTEVSINIGSNVEIGDNSTISAFKSIIIEDNVLISPNVHISDHRHAYEDIKMPIIEQGISNIKPVVIGHASWIGRNSIICLALI